MPDPPCKNFLTWTENVIVTILSHFLRTCTPFSPMGCRRIGTWAWTLLCSISASSTALVPVSPWCPAPIHLKKEQFNTFQSLPFFQYSTYKATFPKRFVTFCGQGSSYLDTEYHHCSSESCPSDLHTFFLHGLREDLCMSENASVYHHHKSRCICSNNPMTSSHHLLELGIHVKES